MLGYCLICGIFGVEVNSFSLLNYGNIDPEKSLIMEDERGAGGHDGGGGSDPPLSSKLGVESSVEDMGGDNQVEEAFVDGDGEEIMVEVVGSDVYVDGISGNGEGDSEMGEAGNLEDSVVDKSTDVFGDVDEKVEKREEFTGVEGKGDGEKMEEGGLGFSESREEKHEKIDINLSESVGVEDELVSASPVGLGGVGGVNDGELNPEIKETAAPAEAAASSPMEICEEVKTKDETVAKDSSEVVTSEPSSHPVEAGSEEKTDLAEEKEVLPASDNLKDSTKSEETHADNDDVAGEVHPVDASGGGEILDSVSPKDGNLKSEADCPSTDDKSAGDKDECPAESGKSVPKSDALVSEVLDESKSCSNEIHGAELKAEETDGVSHASPDSAHENSIENQKGESGGEEFGNVLDITVVASNTNLAFYVL